MDERHRVLIADSYPDEAEQLKKELSGKYNVISVRDNGVDTLDDIIKLKPDLVVIDLMLSEIDGIGVIEKCRELIEPDKIPAFIALTMLENRELMECIRRLKVDYCMMKPFQAGILAERISQMIRIRSVNNDIQKNEKALHGRSKRMCSMCGTNDVRRQISFLVRNLGVPAHIKGCRYMKYAILMAIEDCNRINYITKLLYPEIAKKCKTTTSSVERAIRPCDRYCMDQRKSRTFKRDFWNICDGRTGTSDKFTIYCSSCRLDAAGTSDKSFIRMKIFWRIR